MPLNFQSKKDAIRRYFIKFRNKESQFFALLRMQRIDKAISINPLLSIHTVKNR